MDHNLDDQLTLESAMGVDYVHSDDAGNVKEEAIMMDTAGEEIIVTDYISNPYMLEEMPIEDSDMIQVMHSEEIIGSEEQVYSQDSMLDLQFEEPVSVPAANVIIDIPPSQPPAPRFVTLTQAPIHGVSPLAKKDARQVAIAPKVPRLVHVKRSFPALKSNLVASPALKPLAIAPKPATPQITNKHRSISLVKSSVSTTRANNSVLTPIGKQLVVVGAGGGSVGGVGSSAPRFRLLTQPGAELRLVPQSTGKTQTSTSSIQTPIAKIIQVQGSANSDSSPAVLTRIPKTGTGTSTTISTSIGTGTVTKQVFTMQQKTVPITLGNKQVIMASPTKQGVRYSQKQFITLKTPVKVSSAQDAQTKKVVITANPAQSNLVLKAGAKANQVNKIAPVVPKGQLHKISVPGKGIQYIRLVPTTSAKPATPPTPPPAKTLVFTDAKGNLIQVATDKVSTGQPPPLIVTENALNKCKLPPKKLVRIAPISKTVPVPTSMSQQTRAGQSLLAPITTKAESTPPPLQPITPNTQAPAETFYMEDDTQDGSDSEEEGDEITEIETTDSKTALHALIADTTAGENNTQQELPVEYCPDRDDQPNQSDHQGQPDRPHPLIVVPPSYMNQEQEEDNDKSITSEARRLGNMLNVEVDGYNLFQAGVEPGHDDDDLPTDIDGLRPRKACNCTKSQCLKLYCDCFANGEFCHQCNCNNCHNNLDHEELRQKAIRGCLDRNPNAFRPKIGKAKAGGLDLIRRHNKGCNCKRSGCLKNYCECYEAKIACTTICKCVGCRNVEETLERARRPHGHGHGHRDGPRPAHHHQVPAKQPCSFMTSEVITAVCQCLVAAAGEGGPDPVQGVLDEFARCLQDVIAAAQTKPRAVNQSNA